MTEDKDYIVVTTISTFRHRYVMHKDDLRKLNTDVEPTDIDLEEWALDTVFMEECDEFSQEHLGEQLVESYYCNEDEMLSFFDADNRYLKDWDRDYKIEWVRNTLKVKDADN